MAMDDGSMGGRTWMKLFAILIGVAIAVILVFVFISNSIAKWGPSAASSSSASCCSFGAWLFDKREARKDREYGL